MRATGYGVWTDKDTGAVFERDTVTCAHCGRALWRKPKTAPTAHIALQPFAPQPSLLDPRFDEDLGGFCRCCMANVCGPCADRGTCVPFEKKIEIHEAANRFHRAVENLDLKALGKMREGLIPARIVVWYSDGAKLECAATSEGWVALPTDNVQIVQILYGRPYKGKYLQELLAREDLYWWHPRTEPLGVPGWECGSAHQMPADVQEEHIKFGREIDRAAFLAMYNKACEGVQWP